MINFGNKRGSGNEMMLFIFFVAWMLIGGAIVIGTIVFYSTQIDVRAIETQLLISKTAGCVAKNGFIEIDKLSNSEKLLENCGISNSVNESGYFLMNLTLRDVSNNIIKNLRIGNPDLSLQCALKKEGIRAESFGFCDERIIYGSYYDGKTRKGGFLEIEIGSNIPQK